MHCHDPATFHCGRCRNPFSGVCCPCEVGAPDIGPQPRNGAQGVIEISSHQQDDPDEGPLLEPEAAFAHLDQQDERLARFLRRRFKQMADTISQMADRLHSQDLIIANLAADLAGPNHADPPPEVRHAMRVRSGHMQAVGFTLGGRDYTMVVPPQGFSEREAKQVWAQLQHRYGDGPRT